MVVATELSRVAPSGSLLPGWNSPQQAWAMAQAQLVWYKEMEALGEMVQITNLQQLDGLFVVSIAHQLSIIGILLIASKGAAGVTGSGFLVLTSTLTALKIIPLEGLALLIGFTVL